MVTSPGKRNSEYRRCPLIRARRNQLVSSFSDVCLGVGRGGSGSGSGSGGGDIAGDKSSVVEDSDLMCVYVICFDFVVEICWREMAQRNNVSCWPFIGQDSDDSSLWE